MTGLLSFVALAGCPLATGWHIGRYVRGDAPLVEAALKTAVIAAAIIVGASMAAGVAGRLRVTEVLATEAVVAAAAWWWCGSRRARPLPSVAVGEIPVAAIAMVAATLTFACAFAIRNAPFTLYDSVSYHLFFAARWVQERAIGIIPTPFSDVAQAYAPGNGELLLAWLMLPFHSDVLARMGQLPFAPIAALAVYGIARRLRQPPPQAVFPAAFFLLSRPIVEQAIGADVDLICAAFFLCAVYFLLAAVDADDI